jgi:hypothetical protein
LVEKKAIPRVVQKDTGKDEPLVDCSVGKKERQMETRSVARKGPNLGQHSVE